MTILKTNRISQRTGSIPATAAQINASCPYAAFPNAPKRLKMKNKLIQHSSLPPMPFNRNARQTLKRHSVNFVVGSN